MLLLAAIGCGNGEQAVCAAVYHTDLCFRELKPSGVDAELEIARTKELLFRIGRRELAGERAQEALDARSEAYRKLRTDAALAYVEYCFDVTDAVKKQRYDTLSVQLDALGCLLIDTALQLSEDPALSDRYDAETTAALKREDALSDPAVQPLLERERMLVGQYEALPEKLRVDRNGRSWTGDGILSDPTLSAEEFTALYEQYMQLFNAEAGAIFLELIGVRNEIARTLGFDSYAAYMYACYGRDYTPKDAARLSAAVRSEAVPLLVRIRGGFYAAAGKLYGAVFERVTAEERIRTAIVSLLPELAEPWDYMTSHGMYDLGAEPARMPGSFTTYFAEFGTPFLFSSWTGGFEMMPTFIHEFGHFASYYLRGEAAGDRNALDLAEIDAQGLELLTVLRYDTLYGDLCDAAENAELFYALYALVDGCLEDEFQQFAYGQENITLAKLNDEYGRLSAAYGLDLYGVEARSWTQIPHTFQSPFYYISYAAGMSAALELYQTGKQDPAAATDAYRAILNRGDGARLSETLKKAGLSDPFDAGEIGKMMRGLGNVLSTGKNE